MRGILSVAMLAAILCGCQPIVPERQTPASTPTIGRILTPTPTAEPAQTSAQTPEPSDSDPMWPDMRYTEPIKIEEFEIEWALAAEKSDLKELIGTEFEAELEGEHDSVGLTLFYYSSLLHAQANCIEDDLVLTELIDRQAERISPRWVAEAEVEDFSVPPLTRFIILTVLLNSWEEPLGYLCMDKACLADVEETRQCADWLDKYLNCLFEEDPNACFP